MAKTAQRPPPKTKAKRGPIRPALFAAGLGLYWFVEFQDAGSQIDAPGWGYGVVLGTRLLADFVGAWCAVSGLLLLLSAGRVGYGYLRGRLMRAGA